MASIESPVDELIFGRKFLDTCNHVMRLSGLSSAPNRREYVAHHGKVGARKQAQFLKGVAGRLGVASVGSLRRSDPTYSALMGIRRRISRCGYGAQQPLRLSSS